MTARRLELATRGPPALRTAAVLVGALAACSAIAQQPTESPGPGTSTRTIVIGPTPARRASGDGTISFPFLARADEDLAGARIEVVFARATGPALPGVARIAFLVNEEPVGTFPVEAGEERGVTVHRDLLGARNLLSVRLLDGAGNIVAQHGAWTRVAALRLHLETTPAPLPNDLALLPLPFVDRDVDAEANVRIVLPGPVTPERTRAAALVASWMALDAPVPVAFQVVVGEAPEGRSVILVDDQAQAERLGITLPDGPVVHMADSPRQPGAGAKLLVVGGRSPAELRVAAESLASRSRPLVGAEARLTPAPPAPPALPYSAPRWLPSGRAVPFRDFPLGGTPSHDGVNAATLPIRFRIAPDLIIWPADFITLDLRWTERIAPGVAPARLDLELNGYFLATLPAALDAGEVTRSIRLRIPRQHVRGFNELLVHVKYPDAGRDDAAAPDASARVAISGDSVIHLEGLKHFATLPDMGLFAYDGYPFTRVPDLGETAVVLSANPDSSELSTVVTLLAQFAQVTGRAGDRASFVSERDGDRALADKDLLVVGAALDEPFIARWRPRWPLLVTAGRTRVQPPAPGRAWLELTGGLRALLDRRRARAVLERPGVAGAVMGIESPVSPGRVVVAVTSASTARLPTYRDFLGYAESRSSAANDLLLLAGGQRWMFQIGPTFESGRLAPWNEVRWFLARHWLLLVPFLLLGVVLLGLASGAAITSRMRERLFHTGGEP